MSDDLYILIEVLDKRNYDTFEIVIRTKRDEILGQMDNYKFFREEFMIIEFQKILKDDNLMVIKTREISNMLDVRKVK